MSRKPSATRERILQAANELFYARGFYRVSVDSISEAARVTKRTVYYHFNSKDWLGSGFNRVTMELADMPGHPARLSASQHKKVVEAWLAAELNLRAVANPEELARQFVLLIEGAMVLALIHPDPAYLRSTAGAAKSIVEANLRETLS